MIDATGNNMLITRRSLIKVLALSPLAAAAYQARAATSTNGAGGWKKKLVLVELAGGNDGLNTVIPIEDPLYQRLRPSLGINASDVLGVGDGLALHPSLAKVRALMEAGECGVVLGVGYAQPVRSHFRSSDIWHTGSSSDEIRNDGWVARVAGAAAAKNGAPARGLVVAGDAGALDGPGFAALAADADRTSRRTERPASNAALAHLAQVHEEIKQSHVEIEAVVGQEISERAIEGHAFVEQCKVAARALAGIDVACVKLTLKGFDTHVNQRDQHARLLTELANGLAELRDAANASGVWRNTVVVTTSEFGRRARENGSGGTDHGTAAPMFVLGGSVRHGLIGTQPRLDELDGEGDVKFNTDYRAVLGGVASAAWGVDHGEAKRALGGVEPLALTA
jgi:uncharacterized protein (DUF1501 family)